MRDVADRISEWLESGDIDDADKVLRTARTTIVEQRAVIQQLCSMNLRDTFAAAALTGLCSMPPMSGPDKPMDFARMAYCYADAMLAERAKIIAQCDTAQKMSVSDSLCADADHDAVPAARARTDADRDRTDKAATRPGEGTGNTQEPVAWGVMRDDGEVVDCWMQRKNAVNGAARLRTPGTAVPLYAAPPQDRVVLLPTAGLLHPLVMQALHYAGVKWEVAK
jgi:hypothetical protein